MIVTDDGENVAPAQAVPPGVAAVGSSKVTTVPSGRFCGPFTTAPSAVTVIEPAGVDAPSRK